VNKKSAFTWGLSGTIGADLSKHFSFSSVLNYTYGRIKETPVNYPLDHIPPAFGKTSFTARFGKFTSEIFALYNGTKDSANYNLRGEDNQVYSADVVRGYTPAWITANFRTVFEVNKYASLQVALENIFDKYYRVFGSGLSAPGRNFVISLRARI
ncbi:MAG: TonB-dependent receptor, partial [Gloeobacteraceae cyanobacterium ES-bin-316]|nr:TonB-dependent receptor [Ferruginibacter sp.]